jgi:hypothetical protein
MRRGATHVGLHDRAWSGLGLMVYGATPLVPMKLEQAIAAATPANEVRVESFEKYEDAFEHSKSAKNVGFIFLQEDCGGVSALDVFTQLSRPYEANGYPCFGVLIYKSQESFVGYRTLQRCPNLIGYYSLESLLESTALPGLLDDIWSKYIAAFEAHVLPTALQETFIALATEEMPQGSLVFQDRTSLLLSSTLNVSWVENVALRWHPVIKALKVTSPKILAQNATITQIAGLADYTGKADDLADIVTSKASLCARISAVTALLDRSRLDGTLSTRIQDLATRSKPGAPAMLRHIVAAKAKIIQIALDSSSQDASAQAAVGQ